MSEHKEEKKGKSIFVPQVKKMFVGGKEYVVADENGRFLAYLPNSQLRDAEIASMDVAPHEDAFFEVVAPSSLTVTVRISQASFDACKRARPIIDIVKA
jgi:hypothetical protein